MSTTPLPNIDSLCITCGIEKEALRINTKGEIAVSPHPAALGSALCHPMITTDFAECLAEVITGVHSSKNSLMTELQDTVVYLSHHMLEDELLWPASMPPPIEDETRVNIARFGTSPIGRLKHLYRIGLAERYGVRRQSIAGIHYNVSLEENLFKNCAETDRLPFLNNKALKSHYYMQLIQQFMMNQWLLILLFSASPFAMITPKSAESSNRFSQKHAISCRLGPHGYRNSEIDPLSIRYDSLEHYITDIQRLTQRPSQQYAHIPDLHSRQPKQLSRNVLQIENEFYNSIRPKPQRMEGLSPSLCLQEQGVGYLEIRLFDLNPFTPLSVSKEQLYFTDAFLMHCLMQRHAPFDGLLSTKQSNQVIQFGQNPNTELVPGCNQSIKTASMNLLENIKNVAQWMDSVSNEPHHLSAVEQQMQKIENWQDLPHQKMLALTPDYHASILDLAHNHRHTLLQAPLSKEKFASFDAIAAQSLADQAALEKGNAGASLLDFYQSNLYFTETK